MISTIAYIIFVAGGTFVVVFEILVRNEQIKLTEDYDLTPKRHLSSLGKGLLAVLAISLLTYAISRSFEISMTVGAFLGSYFIYGTVIGLLFEYQTMRRVKREQRQ